MCWNSGDGTRTYNVRPWAWLNRVGLSQVSNDWRMTFISSAERIWIQGLSTVAGETANDIAASLLASAIGCRSGFNRRFWQQLQHGAKIEVFAPVSQIADRSEERRVGKEC